MANRLEKLIARRTDPQNLNISQINEIYKKITQSDAVKYVIGCMQSIDPDYTSNTFAEAERVKNQLINKLTEKCSFEYQGSVTNDTHIKAKSDIDILAIIGKFHTLEDPQKPNIPYMGNPLQDLIELRSEAIDCLKRSFPEAEIDSTGSKSIVIQGGSLRRKIDIVPANWFDTNDYAQTKNKIFRGVQILDAKNRTRIKNTPFLHNALIHEKDIRTNGNLRKAARLIKSLKYDSEAINLSSYDLVSIAYNIPDSELNQPRGLDLGLLNACHNYCQFILDNHSFRSSLKVPDGHRAIFTGDHATIEGLVQLVSELKNLIKDVLEENKRSFTKLSDLRIDY